MTKDIFQSLRDENEGTHSQWVGRDKPGLLTSVLHPEAYSCDL